MWTRSAKEMVPLPPPPPPPSHQDNTVRSIYTSFTATEFRLYSNTMHLACIQSRLFIPYQFTHAQMTDLIHAMNSTSIRVFLLWMSNIRESFAHLHDLNTFVECKFRMNNAEKRSKWFRLFYYYLFVMVTDDDECFIIRFIVLKILNAMSEWISISCSYSNEPMLKMHHNLLYIFNVWVESMCCVARATRHTISKNRWNAFN